MKCVSDMYCKMVSVRDRFCSLLGRSSSSSIEAFVSKKSMFSLSSILFSFVYFIIYLFWKWIIALRRIEASSLSWQCFTVSPLSLLSLLFFLVTFAKVTYLFLGTFSGFILMHLWYSTFQRLSLLHPANLPQWHLKRQSSRF